MKDESVYRERFGRYSLTSLLLRGTSRLLRSSGTWLQRASEALEIPRIVPSPFGSELLSRNHEFRDRHRGRRCFVIGTGPSLKCQDLEPLGGDITFAANTFWKHPVVEAWQPTYYCVADPFFEKDSAEMDEFFHSLTSRIHDSTFFMPLPGYEHTRERLPADRTRYFEYCRTHPRFDDLDFTGPIPVFFNVAQLGIMLAIYMGCSPIYLLGLDHDWLAQHGSLPHFHAGYGGVEGDASRTATLESWKSYRFILESLTQMWRFYDQLHDLARRKGLEVINVTDGGCLDVFPRARYEELISTDAACAAPCR